MIHIQHTCGLTVLSLTKWISPTRVVLLLVGGFKMFQIVIGTIFFFKSYIIHASDSHIIHGPCTLILVALCMEIRWNKYFINPAAIHVFWLGRGVTPKKVLVCWHKWAQIYYYKWNVGPVSRWTGSRTRTDAWVKSSVTLGCRNIWQNIAKHND